MSAISFGGANKRRASAQPSIRYTDDGFPVRNVYFSCGHQRLAYEVIETYFKTVGEVARFRLCPQPTHTFGFVQYQQPEHAAEVLSRSHWYICGVSVRVKEADSCHQPKVPYTPSHSTTQSTDDHDTPSASENANATPVPDLNDDCLFEIFGYLSALDLTSVAEVSPRFQAIARQQFSSKHKIFDADELVEAAEEAEDMIVIEIQVWESFLKHFGSIIVNLSVSSDSMANQALNLITNYCSETLSVLKLDGFSMKGPTVEKVRPLFAGLQKLYLIDCKFTNHFVRMLEGCHRLTKLSFRDQYSNCKMLQFHLPELKTISFKHVDGLSKQHMKKFLERNPQLKKVSFLECERIEVDILPEIVRCVPLVEKIAFKESMYYPAAMKFTRNAIHLKQLRSLKKLKLDCIGNTAPSVFSEMASANVPLEILEVSNCKATGEFISSICQLKTLNAVSLIQIDALKASHLQEVCEDLPELSKLTVDKCPDSFNTTDLIKLVRNAKTLQELDFWHSFSVQIDEDSFKTLIGIIKKRPDSLPLKICVPNQSTILNKVSDELVTANRNKLLFGANSHIYCAVCDEDSDDEYYDDDDDDDDFYGVDDSDDELYPIRGLDMMYVLVNFLQHRN